MTIPKTVRFNDELESKVEAYLEKNEIKFAQLVNMAVEKFISEPQAIELVPIDDKSWGRTVAKAHKKHKQALDKLK